MIGFEEQQKLFDLIGKECEKKIDALVIGGSAMLFYRFPKTRTKDIDIVLFSEADRKYLIEVLQKIGFKTKINSKKISEPFQLVLDDYILDVFAERVFRMKISEEIMGRVEERIEFGKLSISVMSLDDIILSKSMTDRIGDREDAASIIRETNVNWNNVINECIWQSNNSDPRFCIYLHDFLEDLAGNFNVKIPREIDTQIRKIYRDFLDKIIDKK